LFLAACGQQARLQAAAQRPEPSDPAAGWADGYCGAVVQLIQTLSTMPSVDSSTPQRASRTSSELLGSVVDGLDRTLSGLTALGPSPVAGGDAVRHDAIGTFTGIRSRAAIAKQQLDATAADPAATQQALAGASVPLNEISKIDMLQGMNSIPELATASKRALACDSLTTQGPISHTSPTR
jgi:hypothetical protein